MTANALPEELQRSLRYEAVDFYAAFKEQSALQLYQSVFAAQARAADHAAEERLRLLQWRFDNIRSLTPIAPPAPEPGPLTELSERTQQLERLLDYHLQGELETPHERLLETLAELRPLPTPGPGGVVELRVGLAALLAHQQRWAQLERELALAQDRLGALTLLVGPEELSPRAVPGETLYAALLRATGVCLRLQDAKTVNGLVALYKDCTKKLEEVFASLARKPDRELPGEVCARPEEVEGIMCGLGFWERHSESLPVVDQLLPLGRWVSALAEEARPVGEEALREQLDALDRQLTANETVLAAARAGLRDAFLPLATAVLAKR